MTPLIPRPAIAVATALGIALAAMAASATAVAATPGEIVSTFGASGNGTLHRPANIAVLPTANGKVVTVGDVATGIVISRQSTSGRLDATFGVGGATRVDAPKGGNALAATLQPDGKLVVVGDANGFADFLVMRFRTDGALDPTFSGDGIATTDFGGSDAAIAVAIAPGGKIVVAGRAAGTKVGIARYLTNGALDAAFGDHGHVLGTFGSNAEARDTIVQPDGKVVVAGTFQQSNGNPALLLARYRTNGTLDSGFGTSGHALPGATTLTAGDVLRAQGSQFIVAGSIDLAHTGIARFTASGAIDTTFASLGTASTSAGELTRAFDVVVDGSGGLVVIGGSALSSDFPNVRSFVTLFRFSAAGKIDPSFGCNGRVLTELLGTGANNPYQASLATAGAILGNSLLVGVIAAHTSGSDIAPVDSLLVKYALSGAAHAPGYSLVRADGGTSAFGSAPPCGSFAGRSVVAPIVGIANDPTGKGSWSVASDGGVFAFGSSKFFGSTGNLRLVSPVVGMAAAPDGKGYWLAAADGGVFAFGSAKFFGSMGAVHLTSPVVGIAAAGDGNGYRLVAADGGVFTFGTAKFFGSTGNLRLVSPVVGLASTPDGKGYILAARDGGVFAFGAAIFRGSMGGKPLGAPVVGVAGDPDGDGYWLIGRDGGIFAFGAPFFGSTGSTPFPPGSPRDTVGIAAN
ncbi:MAG: Esterase [Actinomycetia bacterium]|nr:Esterase [Actinomycetes bacterium]